MNKTRNQSEESCPGRTSTTKSKKTGKIAAIILAIAVWQAGAMIIGNSLLLAAPLTVARRLIELGAGIDFWKAIGFSFVRIVSGFLLALAAGIALAVAAGRFRFLEEIFYPYIMTVKSTPVASFIVLCLIWLNSKSLSVFIAFLIVLPIVYTNVLQGISSTDRKLLEMADLFRVKWWRRLLYIYIPQITPYLISACSVSIGMSFKAGIAAELIGIPSGSIGERLYEAKVYLDTGDLFAWSLVIITISVLFEKLFIYVSKLILKSGGKTKVEH
ncbi:MAG TPA: ABC transporter permease subunit [Clostridiaceae bacterium]|jgi:NitT/TauT family transport system permease protein|nr:ABC transporter permease subunit [Clostridiaceae bacterium]